METVSTTTPAPVQAQSTTAFIDSIGYDTAIGANDTTYGSLFGDIVSDLDYLGVNRIRTGANLDLSLSSTASYGLQIESLAAGGIKFDLVVDDSHTAAYYIANFNILEEKFPGSIVSIEGQNEIAPASIPAYLTFQAQLYAAVRADPLLNGVPVAGFTIASGSPTYEESMNDDSSEDEGTVHSYTELYPPNTIQSWDIPLFTSDSPGQPYIVTETGYDTDTTVQANGQGVGADQLTDAKFLLDDVFDLIANGASDVYIHELLDEPAVSTAGLPSGDLSEFQFGQFTANNTAKLSAVAIHNLTTILSDPGAGAATYTAGTLSYSVNGLDGNIDPALLQAYYGYGVFAAGLASLPTYGYSYLMEKSNGTFDLAVWAEPEIWDAVTETEIAAPTIPVTVTLANEVASIEVYDPLVGTSPIATYTNVTQVTVGVVDHPIIIEIDPYPATAATTTTTTVTTTSSTSSSSTSSSGSSSSSATTTTTISASGVTVVGSGPDTIALTMAEDAYQGNAQFAVLVNGTQVGGTQTVTAQQGLGQSQVFDVDGTFNSGTNSVQIVYLNDLYGGSPTADRNLYLLSSSYNTSATPAAAIATPSAQDALVADSSFTFTTGTSVPSTTTIGSGSDLLAVTVAEQAFAGDAEFTISVDGVQIGGVQTVTAIASAGESQVFDVMGTFGQGSHDVSVQLVNPAGVSGYSLAERSLYVESVVLDGHSSNSLANTTLDLTSGTADSFAETHTATPAAVLGSGPDTLALFMSEDAYLGNANFTISVDGQVIGGTQTIGELHGSGQTEELDVLGIFAPGSHTVSVDFLNDAAAVPYNAAEDRNLYVDTATINGNTISGSTLTLNNTGSLGFSFTTPGTPAPVTVGGAGPDTLALNVSEDYYQGNAQFTVSVDGQQVGGVQTATAIHSNGQSQVFDLFGTFTGSHTVSVNFLNDATSVPYVAGLDRNLYVGGASVDGTSIANSSLTLLPSGAQSFSFTH